MIMAMRMLKRTWMAAFLMTLSFPVFAQVTIDGRIPVYDSRTKTYLLTLPESAFGGAYQAAVVADDGVTNVKIDGHVLDDVVDFPLVSGDTCYSFVFKRGGRTTRSKLYFTYLPILVLNGTFSNDYVETSLQMIDPDSAGVSNYLARVKWAGSTTNGTWTHKRSYHIKFIDDNGEKMDVSFFGLRDDNHWRLDAGTIDMIRFRNKAACELWADFNTKSYYADRQPEARSYVRGSHMEVFLNGAYNGFYNMSEVLDRKQMKLKKYSEVSIGDSTEIEMRGLLWKAKEETLQTLFRQAEDYDNTQDSWGGFELEYPDLEEVSPTDYSVLYNAVDFVASSDKQIFANLVGDYFDIPVLVDYYVFINTVFAIDNACKNIIWGCYDSKKDKKLTLAVWDLDATVGQHYSDIEGHYRSDEIQPENELDQISQNTCLLYLNKLFSRLKSQPDFYLRVVNRYWELRETVLDPDSLVNRYTRIYQRLQACGALDREEVRWSDTGDIAHRMLDFDDELDYLCDWLRRRIAYMDTHTFACLRGDVNDDGKVNITDVTMLLEYLLTGELITPFNGLNADFNADNKLNITDVTGLIYKILNE